MDKWSLESTLIANWHDQHRIEVDLKIETTNLLLSQKLADLMPTILDVINDKEIDFLKIK